MAEAVFLFLRGETLSCLMISWMEDCWTGRLGVRKTIYSKEEKNIKS